MINRLKWLAPLLLALVASTPAFAAPMALTLDDYDYLLAISIDNQSGSAISNVPIAIPMQPANLVAGLFIQDDAEDWWPVDSALTTMTGVAQGMTSDDQTWWLDVVSQADGSTASYGFHLGESTATRDQSFRFDGTTDIVTADDHADLDITDDLTLEAVMTMQTWPIGEVVIRKGAAYALGMRVSGGNQVYGAIWGTAANETLRPNGDDTIIAWVPTGACGAAHFTCIDEVSADNATTYLHTTGATGEEIYGLGATALITGYEINSVTVHYKALWIASSGTVTPNLCFNSCAQKQAGSPQVLDNSWTAYSEVITRPGGGPWAVTDLNGLQVSMENTPGGAASQGITQIYIVVNFTPYVEVATTADDNSDALVVDTEYTFKFTYDKDLGSDNLDLSVNGTSKDTDDLSSSIATNATAFTVGNALNGWISSVSVKSGATEYLRYDFEPDDLAETQQGDSGNSWTWEGTVEDVSAGGSDHDGTYSLTRDMTGITRWASTLQNKALVVTTVTESTLDVLGDTTVDPGGSMSESEFLFRDAVELFTQNADVGISELAAWYLLATALGLGATVGLFKAGVPIGIAAMPWAGMYWVAWGVGSPIELWLPIMTTLISIGLMFGMKHFQNA